MVQQKLLNSLLYGVRNDQCPVLAVGLSSHSITLSINMMEDFVSWLDGRACVTGCESSRDKSISSRTWKIWKKSQYSNPLKLGKSR